AMSSRNARLSALERERAGAVPRGIERVQRAADAGETQPSRLVAEFIEEVERAGGRVEYAELRDPETLEEVRELDGRALFAVAVWNVTNGERFETYVIPGRRGSGVVCVNGAAAHKVSKGDLVIIAAFSWMDEKEARAWKPHVVFVDDKNRPVELREERGGQATLRRAFGCAAR